ncbi:MAG: molybdenum cofactor biosynthesis protein MoaE [Caulobacterales bacterium]
MIRVQSEPLDSAQSLAAFQARAHNAGALASFTGLVRGGGVSKLVLEHYPGFTESEIARIEGEARKRFDLIDTLIIHRFGALAPGDAIVLVAALSTHRRAALEAVDFLMDYLKTEAPFWKREERADGSHWIEPRADDRIARSAWEESSES